jgi:F-type H+-transporting ATPase subunit epsilon
MQLEILTPEKKLFAGSAEMVTLPGIDGGFQILDRHAPLISALTKGEIKIKSEGKEEKFMISGGFADCQNNKVIVLVEKVLA